MLRQNKIVLLLFVLLLVLKAILQDYIGSVPSTVLVCALSIVLQYLLPSVFEPLYDCVANTLMKPILGLYKMYIWYIEIKKSLLRAYYKYYLLDPVEPPQKLVVASLLELSNNLEATLAL